MIKNNVESLLKEMPEGVTLLAAAKTRNAGEITEAIKAGIKVIGENYLQDTEKVFFEIEEKAEWHFIGHIQTRKVKKIVEIFNMIESVDSLKLAREIDKCCKKIDKIMPISIEVNSGEEAQKSGVLPKDVEQFARDISSLDNIKIMGLMTMGPRFGDPEQLRPFFKITKDIFEQIRNLNLPNVEMKYLSMGMTNSYRVALEEGANLIRIGTKIFGERIRETEF